MAEMAISENYKCLGEDRDLLNRQVRFRSRVMIWVLTITSLEMLGLDNLISTAFMRK